MLHPEIEKIDNQVQTSLEDLNPESRGQIEEELQKLREDKSLLEGKIRGYLTLSDICREYKEELSKLQQDYNNLQEKVKAQSSIDMANQLHNSESPTPDNDLGTVNGQRHEQRTQTHDPKAHQSYASSSINNFGSVASNILREKDVPVRTKELFDLVEDPPKSSEGTKSMPHSVESTVPYRDKYPMQESIAAESNQSITGLGFEHVPSDDIALGQSAGNMGHKQSGDLMNFSVPHAQAPMHKIPVTNDDQELENILKSVQLDSADKVELRKVIATVKSYSNSHNDKLQKTNAFLVDKSSEYQHTIKQLQEENQSFKEDNQRLVQKVRSLEQQVYDLSMSRSMTPKDSSATGWVHVQKLSENGEVAKTTEQQQQRATSVNEELETLRQKNQQLTEANQRWSNEWNKLVSHYDNRIADLQTERDRMAKELTEFKISEEGKQRDYEKMLMNSKKKASEEENAKEEAYLQLTSANNRADAVQIQLAESEDTVAALRREKQVLETELSVIRQRPVTSSEGSPPGSRTGRNQMELHTENDVLRQQLLVFQEDFDRERSDRAKAQSLKDEYKKQNEQYKKRVRHLEQKNFSYDRQFKTLEESNKRFQEEKIALQQEKSSLQAQLQRELEKTRNYIPSQMAYQPQLVQSAGLQPQRQVIFGQQVQPRPQQYVIQPTYEQQRVPQLNGRVMGYNVQPPGAQYLPVQQGVVNPPSPYYQANQAGRQTEVKPGAWSCDQCTFMNYPGRTVCEVCGYIRSPSATQQNHFVYRSNGNETLHARGEPQRQHQQQQQPIYGYGGPSAQRDITTDNLNNM